MAAAEDGIRAPSRENRNITGSNVFVQACRATGATEKGEFTFSIARLQVFMSTIRLSLISLALICAVVGFEINRNAMAAGSNQDDTTLLYLSFENTLNGAAGEVPIQTNGIRFRPGISGGAASFPVGSKLQYATQNNINVKGGEVDVVLKAYGQMSNTLKMSFK